MNVNGCTARTLVKGVLMAIMYVGGAQAGEPPMANRMISLEEMNISLMDQGWGVARAKRSMDGNPLRLKGKTYENGVGTHSRSEFIVDLKGAATRFQATVGVDDESRGRKGGTATFEVWVDGQRRCDSGVMRCGDAPRHVAADLHGARELRLVVTDANDWIEWDHADWADAVIELAPDAKARPEALQMGAEPPIPIARPKAIAEPAIHGPRVAGATPGRAFVFLVPATGQGPLEFSAEGLPSGLNLDPATGVISGAIAAPGESIVRLQVKGPKGTARRKLKIVAGQGKLALTPPMGWNSWNAYENSVDEGKVRAAAEALIRLGLAGHGYQYVNIDDGWAGGRGFPSGDEKGNLRPNGKFGSIKALADWLHGKGLRLGIYTSPGPKTCGGFTGAYGHEAQDARTFAEWGVDYLKYDWCSYEQIAKDHSLAERMAPYRKMGDALRACDRDIVYSICQYGAGEVWKWGPKVGGNLWRTTGDIFDSWGTLSMIAARHAGLESFVGPGRWNDPDMLVIGRVHLWTGSHPTRLTPNEQIYHVSMWAMLAAPLMIGCDLAVMDEFTLSLLTNDDVLDVDQDPLGRPARRISANAAFDANLTEVWVRPLWDGTMAVGLFNLNPRSRPVSVDWAAIGLKGEQPVRDLWERKDVGVTTKYQADVPGHGARLLKVGRPVFDDWPDNAMKLEK